MWQDVVEDVLVCVLIRYIRESITGCLIVCISGLNRECQKYDQLSERVVVVPTGVEGGAAGGGAGGCRRC